MSPAHLEISEHAAERLRERVITRSQVRQCLAKGELTGLDLRGRFVREIKITKRILVVVYLQAKAGYIVITAYWRS
ncbi:MAG: DUF4258 domain-containing protein [Proteobacteria bacterium]|nr:DUF4258 domain-containing protein [Pseudomonadota bacterium]